MRFSPHQPTLELLRGLKGVELGAAAHNSFGVDAINVAPKFDEEFYREAQIKICAEAAPIDKYGHAAEIPVEDNSQDFVLSSHVLEHVPDPLSAFLEWTRVVRPGGYVVMIVPQPDALPGDDRSLSKFSDLKRAYHEGWTIDTAPEDAAHGRRGGHYWKFTSETLKAFIARLYRKTKEWPGLKWELVGEEDPDSKVGNGFWLAYQVK